MKKIIFGGFCFLGGLLMLLLAHSYSIHGGPSGIDWLGMIIAIFGFVLGIIGLVKKDDTGNG